MSNQIIRAKCREHVEHLPDTVASCRQLRMNGQSSLDPGQNGTNPLRRISSAGRLRRRSPDTRFVERRRCDGGGGTCTATGQALKFACGSGTFNLRRCGHNRHPIALESSTQQDGKTQMEPFRSVTCRPGAARRSLLPEPNSTWIVTAGIILTLYPGRLDGYLPFLVISLWCQRMIITSKGKPFIEADYFVVFVGT